MTAWAVIVLLEMTLLLAAGIVIAQIAGRSAAARHSVLLWTLAGAALCPVMAIAPAPLPVHAPITLTVPLRSVASIAPLESRAARTLDIPAILLLIWAAGALVAMARLGSSLLAVRRLRAAAEPVADERIAGLAAAVGQKLGRRCPAILLSERVGVPMTLGFIRSVVVLPASILDRLDDRQLLQVLMHECAHAVRQDGRVGLFQRLLAAMFWFHPLIHIANRLLDHAREEICDNYVLRIDGAREYCSTLLALAQSISHAADARLAPSLWQSKWSLEDRVAGLLNSGRCPMTKLTPGKSAAIAAAFLGGALAFTCIAGSPQQDFSHIVPLRQGSCESGDAITIDEVRGPSTRFVVGRTYEVTGHYKLVSQDEATIAAFVTITAGARDIHPDASPGQTMSVSKGEGRFTLRLRLWQAGDPHVSFYPAGGGNSFCGVYMQ